MLMKSPSSDRLGQANSPHPCLGLHSSHFGHRLLGIEAVAWAGECTIYSDSPAGRIYKGTENFPILVGKVPRIFFKKSTV